MRVPSFAVLTDMIFFCTRIYRKKKYTLTTYTYTAGLFTVRWRGVYGWLCTATLQGCTAGLRTATYDCRGGLRTATYGYTGGMCPAKYG